MKTVKPVSAKKQYREQLGYAKAFVKGINAYVDGTPDSIDLEEAMKAAKNLEIVAANLQFYINKMKAGA